MSSVERSSEYGPYGFGSVAPGETNWESRSVPTFSGGVEPAGSATGSSWSKVTTSRPSFLYAGEARIFGTQVERKASAAAGPPGCPAGHSAVEPALQRPGVT